MIYIGYQYGRKNGMIDVDKAYERQTDRMIDEIFGGSSTDGNKLEAFHDVEIAIKHLKKARDWMGEAMNEGVDKPLEYKIGSFYDEIDDLSFKLERALEEWDKQ